jgi:hypothetical protein
LAAQAVYGLHLSATLTMRLTVKYTIGAVYDWGVMSLKDRACEKEKLAGSGQGLRQQAQAL